MHIVQPLRQRKSGTEQRPVAKQSDLNRSEAPARALRNIFGNALGRYSYAELLVQPPGLIAVRQHGVGEIDVLRDCFVRKSADLVQTRSLKTFNQPFTNHGGVWFAPPDRFRWELGAPAATLAVRQPAQLLVLYPKLHRAERYPLNGAQTGPWKDALALLEAGFPRSASELGARFKVLSQTLTNDLCEIALAPRSASARRMMPQFKISFATNTFALRATELHFADGSTLRNDFSASKLNQKLDDALFAPSLDGFEIVEPLKKP